MSTKTSGYKVNGVQQGGLTATLEELAYPAKRLRPRPASDRAPEAAAGTVESLDGVVHEWIRQYQPELFLRLQRKEAHLRHLAAELQAATDSKLQEALRYRLDAEKRELVAWVWDAIALFEGKPPEDPLLQGSQLGLLVAVADPQGQIYYIARSLLPYYLKEGYQVV